MCNLVWKEENGSEERQQKMRSMGAHKILQQLLNTNDKSLFEKLVTLSAAKSKTSSLGFLNIDV